jgi:hypothetical protein
VVGAGFNRCQKLWAHPSTGWDNGKFMADEVSNMGHCGRMTTMIDTDISATRPQRLFRYIGQRDLALPLLCFIAGHRPLAFMAGQMLYLFEPLAGLLGQSSVRAWAALLSDPAGPALLTQTLTSPSPDSARHPITQPPQAPHDHNPA